MPNLYERWQNLMYRVGARGDVGAAFNNLTYRYCEHWRAYHTLAHIEAMLDELDLFRKSPESIPVDLEVVEMVAWYHDIVCEPLASLNEENSAELFKVDAFNLRLKVEPVEKVIRAIIATKHIVPAVDINERAACDIDLTILGKAKDVFDNYERQIYREYDRLLPAQFCAGRLPIVKNIVSRPRIYLTDFFRDKYEVAARENLARSIERLSAGRVMSI